METLLKKLNYKAQSQVVLKNLPENLESLKNEFEKTTQIFLEFSEVEQSGFAIVFVMKQSQIDEIAPIVAQKILNDDVLWFAYPKGTSKRYKCDFNRDTGWESLGKVGFEGVRMVAMDEDWSALRFRRVEFIKTMARNEKIAISEKGKERTKEN